MYPGIPCETVKQLHTRALITARKRSLGQGNIFTGVSLSTGEGVYVCVWHGVCKVGGVYGRGVCMAGDHVCRRDGH